LLAYWTFSISTKNWQNLSLITVSFSSEFAWKLLELVCYWNPQDWNLSCIYQAGSVWSFCLWLSICQNNPSASLHCLWRVCSWLEPFCDRWFWIIQICTNCPWHSHGQCWKICQERRSLIWPFAHCYFFSIWRSMCSCQSTCIWRYFSQPDIFCLFLFIDPLWGFFEFILGDQV